MTISERVLVTGGAGYIGSVLTEMLLAEGCTVTVLDRFFFGDTLADRRADPRLRTIRERLGYCTTLTPEDGAREVYEGLESGKLANGPKTKTVDWYESLIEWHRTTEAVGLKGAIL